MEGGLGLAQVKFGYHRFPPDRINQATNLVYLQDQGGSRSLIEWAGRVIHPMDPGEAVILCMNRGMSGVAWMDDWRSFPAMCRRTWPDRAHRLSG